MEEALHAADDASLGCGVVALLPGWGCGVLETSRIASYLAAESAGQCGPCVHGLAAITEVLRHLVHGHADSAQLDLL